MKISDFNTLTFDCYGTLIDWETGIYHALDALYESANISADKESRLLQYRQIESKVQSTHPTMLYADLLRTVHENLAIELGADLSAEKHLEFAAAIKDWPAFADSAESLQYLKQHFKLVILSNVDRAGFAASNLHLKVEFDAIYTAEDIGSYKPDPRNFEYMLEKLDGKGISQSDILHVAQSLHHDMVPATRMGFSTSWIDRRANQPGSGATPPVENPPKVDMRFLSLADFADAHRRELR